MAGTFLQRSRHGTVFYFRRRVPDDLRQIIGKPSIVKSLGTEQRREAIIRARAYAAKTDTLYHDLRSMKKSDGTKVAFSLAWITDGEGQKRAVANDVRAGEGADAAIGVATLQAHLDGVPLPIQAPIAPIRPNGMLFQEALDHYYRNAQLKPTTKRTYRSRLQHAQIYFGSDKDVRQIEQVDVSNYARHVRETVPNRSTQGDYIRNVTGFLNFLRIDQGWGVAFTTKTLIPKKDTPDSEDRDAFSLDQISAIFDNARKYKHSRPCKYWVTLAIAFTGCRIEELVQIRIDNDLRQDQGSKVWFLDLNGKPDPDGVQRRSLKNPSSWRCVPIHPVLVKLGFVQFLQDQMKAGFTRPFESGWKPSMFDDGEGGKAYKWSHYVANWGGRQGFRTRPS